MSFKTRKSDGQAFPTDQGGVNTSAFANVAAGDGARVAAMAAATKHNVKNPYEIVEKQYNKVKLADGTVIEQHITDRPGLHVGSRFAIIDPNNPHDKYGIGYVVDDIEVWDKYGDAVAEALGIYHPDGLLSYHNSYRPQVIDAALATRKLAQSHKHMTLGEIDKALKKMGFKHEDINNSFWIMSDNHIHRNYWKERERELAETQKTGKRHPHETTDLVTVVHLRGTGDHGHRYFYGKEGLKDAEALARQHDPESTFFTVKNGRRDVFIDWFKNYKGADV